MSVRTSGFDEAEGLPHRTASVRSLPAAIAAPFATLAGTGFLYAYIVFHALHVAGRDPGFMKILSSIPLFAACLASAFCGVTVAGLTAALAPDLERMLPPLPRALGIAVILFSLEVVLFP